jgi:hypothetical protein
VTAGLAGRKVLQGPKIPISAEQDENLLARFEAWRATWNGSLPEFITFEFLTLQKKQVPNVDFFFQHPLFGGRTRFGGFLLDFFLVSRREGWRIQGERYHLLKPVDRARGRIARAKLMAEGLTIVDLWESDLLERPLFVLTLAWERSAEVQSRAPR